MSQNYKYDTYLKYSLTRDKFLVLKSDFTEFPYHNHMGYELSYLLSGEMEQNVNGKISVIHPNEYFIIDYDSSHGYKSANGEKVELINLMFYSDFIEKSAKKFKPFSELISSAVNISLPMDKNFSLSGVPIKDTDGTIKQLFLKVNEEFEKKRIGYLEYIRSALIQIVITYLRNQDTIESEEENDIVHTIKKYVLNNFNKKISLSRLASEYNYSFEHLSRLFHEKTGQTFVKYLQSVRIENACHLLANTNYSVTDVAVAVGYSDIKTFTSVFKNHLNITPRQYRINALK